MRVWFECIGTAATRRQLEDGVYCISQGDNVPFDGSVVAAEAQRTRDGYLAVMRDHKRWFLENQPLTFVLKDRWLEDSADGIPSHALWTATVLWKQGVEPTVERVEKAMPRLDAAYRYYRSVYVLMKQGYNFEKDSSAWADSQQLLYLADPGLHLVTDDKDFRLRTTGTPQRDQILSSEEFFATL